MKETIMKAIDFSALAYQEHADIEKAIQGQADNFTWIENKETDTQVFICEDDIRTWVTARGTQFDSFNDWITNLNCSFVQGPWGKVHAGFWKDTMSVIHAISSSLLKNIISGKQIIFTGHSQGAAVAELYFSRRCFLLPDANHLCIPVEPPRSMSKEAADKFGTIHGHNIYHVINNNDIVCRVPTRFMGYGHVKHINLNYLDEPGNLHHDISWWERFKDRVKGRVYDFGELGTDGIKDHDIVGIQNIWRKLV